MEEPLADIDFPSIEEAHAQDKAFAGDWMHCLILLSPLHFPVRHFNQPGQTSAAEPNGRVLISFDNLTPEDALGDEKYAHAQVELGDVDAVLGESIRDFEIERRVLLGDCY